MLGPSGLSLDSRPKSCARVLTSVGLYDADMVGAVAIGHRTAPNDAYRLIWDWQGRFCQACLFDSSLSALSKILKTVESTRQSLKSLSSRKEASICSRGMASVAESGHGIHADNSVSLNLLIESNHSLLS